MSEEDHSRVLQGFQSRAEPVLGAKQLVSAPFILPCTMHHLTKHSIAQTSQNALPWHAIQAISLQLQ